MVVHFKGIHLQIIHSLSILMMKRKTTTNEKKIGNVIMESINVLFIFLSLSLLGSKFIYSLLMRISNRIFFSFLIHLKSLIWLLIIFFLLALTLYKVTCTQKSIHLIPIHSRCRCCCYCCHHFVCE